MLLELSYNKYIAIGSSLEWSSVRTAIIGGFGSWDSSLRARLGNNMEGSARFDSHRRGARSSNGLGASARVDRL